MAESSGIANSVSTQIVVGNTPTLITPATATVGGVANAPFYNNAKGNVAAISICNPSTNTTTPVYVGGLTVAATDGDIWEPGIKANTGLRGPLYAIVATGTARISVRVDFD